jgi:hypothetical protein
MTVRTTADASQATPLDYIGALKLAVEAGANMESTNALMIRILEYAPEPEGSATKPTKILIDAFRDLGATVSVP